MKKRLNQFELIALLEKRCEEYGSQKAFADKHGISAQYITDVIRRRREPGEKILSALGLRKVVTYEVIEQATK